ncbi:MAG TPA: dihydroorotase [Thermomicrobiaceae bacterium]|nr:dihydroorotase [Thermomicrobiaceae bacterium]
MELFIQGGRVIDPEQGLDEVADILVSGDRIAAVGPSLTRPGGVDKLNAHGMLVMPGLVDVHAHLRDPGFTAKETLETGAQSALKGGFTTVCCMPNTDPALDTPERVADIVTRARELPLRLFPLGAISLERRGEELADLAGMTEAGAVGFSDDGDSTRSSQVMREALAWSKDSGKPIMVHCEDWTLINGGVMHEGAVSRELGLPGIPAAAEEIITNRDIELARLTGGWLHVLHVSTALGRDLVRRAKEQGVPVTAEVMPHHLLLTDEWVAGRRRFVGDERVYRTVCPDPNAKVNPPLRGEADARALLAGLREGTFDILATDHAPHAPEDKSDDLLRAANGMIGFELALPLLLRLVRAGDLSLLMLVDLLSTRPARLFGLPGGRLRPGSPADLIVVDPEQEWNVNETTIASKSKNTPLLGMTVQGKVRLTMVNGEVRYRD